MVDVLWSGLIELLLLLLLLILIKLCLLWWWCVRVIMDLLDWDLVIHGGDVGSVRVYLGGCRWSWGVSV